MSRQSYKPIHPGALAPVCKLETPEYTGNQMSVNGGVFWTTNYLTVLSPPTRYSY